MSRITGPFEGDLGTYFNELSKTVTYAPSGVNPVSINGLFDDSGAPVTLQNGEVQQGKPKIVFPASLVPNASSQDTVTIDGILFYVTLPEDYQDGLKLLWLSEDPPTQRA